MGKPVAGEVVVFPFPQTNLQSGKRRPALVVADLAGTTWCSVRLPGRRVSMVTPIPLVPSDFERGRLAVDSFIRANRLFTVEQSVILYTAGKIKDAKLQEVKSKIRQLFA